MHYATDVAQRQEKSVTLVAVLLHDQKEVLKLIDKNTHKLSKQKSLCE